MLTSDVEVELELIPRGLDLQLIRWDMALTCGFTIGRCWGRMAACGSESGLGRCAAAAQGDGQPGKMSAR
jgi:hypothetical protein